MMTGDLPIPPLRHACGRVGGYAGKRETLQAAPAQRCQAVRPRAARRSALRVRADRLPPLRRRPRRARAQARSGLESFRHQARVVVVHARENTRVLAEAFRQAIEANLPSQRGLTARVLVRAEDTDETFTFWLEDGALRLEEGEAGRAQIRILGDSEAILALTRLRLRPGDDALRLGLQR